MPDTPIKPPSKPTVETLEQRLDGMDKAIVLLQQFADRTPTTTNVQGEVKALKELTETKIDGLKELVEAKFEGNKTALDAALKTQKEASDKIEANFSKQFESITSISAATSKATDDKIGDLKDRVTANEGRGVGRNDIVGWIVAAVVVAGGLVGIVVAIVART